jgi:hypothetical protein
MKYGEELLTRTEWTSKGIVKGLVFRYRIDPIPFMGKRRFYIRKWFRAYHKRPRTTQEKRYSNKYTRAKRNKTNLVSIWDDILRGDVRNRRSWKKRCKFKKQWMKNENKRKIRIS